MISDKLKEQLGDWTCLYPFFESEEWTKIKEALKPDLGQITPDVSVWFRAFKECKYENLKVVWLGLSPYFSKDLFTKENVADGLAFSTDNKHSVPPSLFKLYKGLEHDMWDGMNLEMMRNNNLQFLADQGVLLLNSALTTTFGKSDSHLKIWKPFILFLIKTLNEQRKDIVFCGFGAVANELLTRVDTSVHKVFQREHPAAASYASRDWDHDSVFSKMNDELLKRNKESIAWDKFLVDMEVPF